MSERPRDPKPGPERPEPPRAAPAPKPAPLPPKPAPLPPKIYGLDRDQLERESTLSFVRGSGPGGQHRNKVETGVRLVHEPSGVVIVATDHRSQVRNRESSFERLIEKLKELNHRPKKRKKTRKPRSANRKRLNAKRQNSEKKQGRRSRGDD